MEKNKKLGIALLGMVGAVVLLCFFLPQQKKEKTPSMDMEIDNGDEKINWQEYPTYDILLEESITIKEEGVYHVTGSLTDGLITVDTSSNVKLLLDNVSITNTNGPGIFISNASHTVIEVIGENYIADGSLYQGYEEDEVGAIYSHDDLIFQGQGTLKVVSNKEDAIVSKDDLKFVSGNYEIEAVDDGIRGKDSVYIQDGTYRITSSGDGIKATNDKDEKKGYVYIQKGTFSIFSDLDGISSASQILIEEGTFKISSGDDGIHAEDDMMIEGGTIDITQSKEGLEASNLTMKGGTLSIVARDDGINVAGAKEESHTLTILGGKIVVDASGDGIDVNGSAYMKDGEVTIYGPTNRENGALDYDDVLEVTGGTIIASGAIGMDQAISPTSTIYGVWIRFAEEISTQDQITFLNREGKVILNYHSPKNYSSLVVVSPSFQKGETYHIQKNGEEIETFTISTVVTTIDHSKEEPRQ